MNSDSANRQQQQQSAQAQSNPELDTINASGKHCGCSFGVNDSARHAQVVHKPDHSAESDVIQALEQYS
ncbi:hypothetical protein BGZ81_004213, partial [Podila clonocystis]